MQNKVELRKWLRAKRIALPLEEQEKAALAAAALLASHSLFQKSQHIACYIACNSEMDVLPIIRAIWENQKTCYLPVLSSEEHPSLAFYPYHQGNTLISNRYNILEPEDRTQLFPAENLDLVIAPLVGYDLEGNRLGTGGGYYDRTFAFLSDNLVKKPCLIGLAYQIQEVRSLPSDSWDIKLNGVLTEKKLQLCHPGRSEG